MDFLLLYLALSVGISMHGHPVLYSAHWFGVGSASRFLWTPRTVYIGLALAHPVDIALSGLVIGRSGGGG